MKRKIKKLLSKIYNLDFRFKLFFFPIWNKLKFNLKGVLYGPHLKVYTKVFLKIGCNAKINIGSNFTFTSGDCINPLSRNIRGCIVANPGSIISIGNNVGMSSPCIWAYKEIRVGNNVKIGGDCIIMDSDAHSLNYMDRRNFLDDFKNKKDNPIIIGDDVLIGARCILLKGVTIGSRSVIGSGSIVTKSIPADCIAAGNPCKVIKYF